MLNGAIIGFGKIARANHLSAFQSNELKNKIRILSAVEIDTPTRETSAKLFGNIKFYESLDKMYDGEKIDFIDITTPPKYHKEIIDWAVEKGLHIICEKPFTLSLSEAKELYTKINDSKILFLPCHQYKYSPLWKNFKDYIDQLNKDEKFFKQINVLRTSADPGLNINIPPWRLNKEISGGGILADTGFHYLYLSNWLLGKPNKVTAINHNLAHNSFQVEDTAQVILDYDGGIIQLNLSWAYHSRRNEAKLISKNGSIFYDGSNYLTKFFNGVEEKVFVPDASDKTLYTKLYIQLFADFADDIQNNKLGKDGLNEAYNTIYLLDACYESAQQQKTIKLR